MHSGQFRSDVCTLINQFVQKAFSTQDLNHVICSLNGVRNLRNVNIQPIDQNSEASQTKKTSTDASESWVARRRIWDDIWACHPEIVEYRMFIHTNTRVLISN